MKRSVRILCAVVICFVFACLSLALAQDKAKWTGTWKMVPAKSQFAQGGPSGIVIKLEMKDGVVNETMIVVTEGGGERSLTAAYTTDGKVSTQEVMGRSAQTSAKWEGEALVIEFKAGNGVFTRKITLSADGKTMTIAARQSNDRGDSDDTVVLEKQ